MSATYLDVLERMKEERFRLCLSQDEMSRCIRIDQSNYSKVELGTRRLKFAEMKCLCEAPVDVHYIFTGQRAGQEYRELFAGCSYEALINVLGILMAVEAASYSMEVSVCWKDIYVSIEELCSRGKLYKEGMSTISMVRRLNRYQQQEVAQKLGVDVKKYRGLENGRKLPDSELVWELYHLFYIPPAIILKDRSCLISEICYALENLEGKIRERAIELIRAMEVIE